MNRWARLTWQSADPAGLSAGLERRLGVPGRNGGLVEGARLLHLGTAELEVRAWHSEGPHDTPRGEGRLVLEPVIGGEPAPEPPETGAVDLVLLGLGWATVELERAEADLDVWLAPGVSTATPDDRQLGARSRVRRAGALPAGWVVLLEPSTEGRAAASLARDGEGPCALYLQPVAGLEAWLATAVSRGVAMLGAVRPDGPFGAQALLAGNGPAGPHVIVVEGRSPASPDGSPGTIAP